MSKQNIISLKGIDTLLDVMTRISPAQSAIDNIHILEQIKDNPEIQLDSFVKTSLRGLIKENKQIRSQEEAKYNRDSSRRRQKYLQEEWQKSSRPRQKQSRQRDNNNSGTITSRRSKTSQNGAHRRQDINHRQTQSKPFQARASKSTTLPTGNKSLPGFSKSPQYQPSKTLNPGIISNNSAAIRLGNLRDQYAENRDNESISSPSSFYRPSRSSSSQPMSESNGLAPSQSSFNSEGFGYAHLDMHD